MAKSGKTKMLFGAWLNESLVVEVDNWLKTQPQMNRSAFLVSAVDNKLQQAGIVLPRDAVTITPRKAKADFRPQSASHRKNRSRSEVSRASKVHFEARVDERIVGGIERWLGFNPESNRAAFLLSAVIEELQRKGVELPPDTTQIKEDRRPLRHQAYKGIVLQKKNVIKQMADCAQKMQKLTGQLRKDRLPAEPHLSKTILKDRKNMTAQLLKQIEAARSRLLGDLEHIDALIKEGDAVERKAKAVGLM